ncbi:MAG: nucleotidyltransferase family protein [Prevotella sp.]|nr:nucleotidyltransferase family protein [Prevotella sp.]
MIDSSVHTLFQLLRFALGNKTECISPYDIYWQKVIDLSFEQGVAAIAVDGLKKLYGANSELKLEIDSEDLEDLKYEWFGEVMRLEDDYRKYVEDISSLAKFYSEAGIEMMLLKGYGLSLNYPIPAHRLTGDIDIYLSDWKKGDEIIRRNGIVIDYSHHHHSVFNWKGQIVENHYDIENRYASKKGRQVDDLLKELAHASRKEVIVGNVKVYLPSSNFNGIFLISHCASHFVGDHITLRHLLDWALFVDKEWKEIDWQFVTDWLSRLGLWQFLSCMNALSIDYLGIPTDKFPSLNRDPALEKRVLADILYPTFSEKGFGFFFKLRRLRANMWKRNLVVAETFIPQMLRLAWSHVVKPEKRIDEC